MYMLIETTLLSLPLFIFYCDFWVIKCLDDFVIGLSRRYGFLIVYNVYTFSSNDRVPPHIRRLPHIKQEGYSIVVAVTTVVTAVGKI